MLGKRGVVFVLGPFFLLAAPVAGVGVALEVEAADVLGVGAVIVLVVLVVSWAGWASASGEVEVMTVSVVTTAGVVVVVMG